MKITNKRYDFGIEENDYNISTMSFKKIVIVTIFFIISAAFFIDSSNAKHESISVTEAKVYSEIFLKENMKDPSSLKVIRNHKISGGDKDIKMLVMYRSKNSFDAYVVETKEIEVYLVNDKVYCKYND